MFSIRIVAFTALTCMIPGLVSCAHQDVDLDRQVELQLAEYHTSWILRSGNARLAPVCRFRTCT